MSIEQQDLFQRLKPLYADWNAKINLISRQDIDNFYLHHVLFSLAVARILQFKPGTRIIDIGTGGGFPGIPLAILFPQSNFTLLDSIGKKIKVVKAVRDELNLGNVFTEHSRSENYKGTFDFIIGRAVTSLPDFYHQTKHLWVAGNKNTLPNGLIYLTGGNPQWDGLPKQAIYNEWLLSKWFTEDFYNTKKIIHVSLA